jgi:hypothetical protein
MGSSYDATSWILVMSLGSNWWIHVSSPDTISFSELYVLASTDVQQPMNTLLNKPVELFHPHFISILSCSNSSMYMLWQSCQWCHPHVARSHVSKTRFSGCCMAHHKRWCYLLLIISHISPSIQLCFYQQYN